MTQRKISASAIEDLQRVLGDAPQRRPREFSQKQAVRLLFPEIRVMQTRGYSVTEIAQVLSERGVEVAPTTLRTLLSIFRCAAEKSLGHGALRDTKEAGGTPSKTTANQYSGLPKKSPERPSDREESSSGLPGKLKAAKADRADGVPAIAAEGPKRSPTPIASERIARPGTFIPREDSDEI
jgi:hypothetical protein